MNRLGLPPPKFTGKASDWDSFEFRFKAYMKVSDGRYSEIFDQIDSHSEEITDTTFVDSDGSVLSGHLELSHQLAWVLSNVCEGSSEAVLRSSATKHGFEQRYACTSEMTALSLLTDIV